MTDSSARFLPARDYGRLKAGFRRLLEKCGGGVQAGQVTRADSSRLSRYGATHEAMFAPIDVIADLEADVNDPVVTRVLADLGGFLLVAKRGGGAGMTDTQALGALAVEAGDIIRGWGEALADDGRVSAPETVKLLGDVHQLQEILAVMEARLDDIAGADDD